MDDDEIKHTIEQTIISERLKNDKEVRLRDCSKRLAEDPEIKKRLREFLPFIKKKIEEINNMDESELVEKQDLDSTSIPAENEYEELEKKFTTILQEDEFLSDKICGLLVYGSYAIEKQVMGQSDVNFVLILDNAVAEDSSIQMDEHLDTLIQSIMNPLYVHLFDLIVLYELDIENLDEIGPAFGYIHALSAKNGKVLIGENPFKDIEEDLEKIKNSAKEIISHISLEFEQIFSNTEEFNIEDQTYLAAEAVVDLALALTFYYNNEYENITKPELLDYYNKTASDEFKAFNDVVSEAWKFKIDISLQSSEEEFIERSKEFFQRAKDSLLNGLDY